MPNPSHTQMMFLIAKHQSTGIAEKDLAFALGVSVSQIKVMLDDAVRDNQIELIPSNGRYRSKLQVVYRDNNIREIDVLLFRLHEILQSSPKGKRKEEIVSVLECTEKELDSMLLQQQAQDFIIEEHDDYLRYKSQLEHNIGTLVQYKKTENQLVLSKNKTVFILSIIISFIVFVCFFIV